MDIFKITIYLYIPIFYENMCEKPTPLGVGWIAQNKNNMYVKREYYIRKRGEYYGKLYC